VLDRLRPWVDALAEDTVAVCHIGIMRILMAVATGWAFRGPAPFKVKRNRLFILDRARDEWQLNDMPIRLERAT
jgi:probable phosphoglycerate mutase